MPNPNTVREVRCNHLWEPRLVVVGTNIVHTPGYKSTLGHVIRLSGCGDMSTFGQQHYCNSFFTFDMK
jgi:hypothetical protein